MAFGVQFLEKFSTLLKLMGEGKIPKQRKHIFWSNFYRPHKKRLNLDTNFYRQHAQTHRVRMR